MIIYKVKSKEGLADIASKFGTSLKRISADNGLHFSASLVEGQNLIITSPISTYIASAGDSVDKISSTFSVDKEKILQMNPELSRGAVIKSGDEIVIDNGRAEFGEIRVMASLKPDADIYSMSRIMPYLTYVSVRASGLRSDGSLYMQNDSPLRELAREHRVIPILEVQKASSLNDGWWNVLDSVDGVTRCAQNIKQAVLSNGYKGVNFNLGEIPEGSFESYVELISTVKAITAPWDIEVISTIPENTVLSSDIELLSDTTDTITLFPKNTGRDIMDVLEIEDIARLVGEVAQGAKISLSVPMTALDVMLDANGSVAREEKFSTAQATRLAMERRAKITYDETRCLSEYDYFDMEYGAIAKHHVEFEDLEGLYEILCIGRESGIHKINVFNADKFYVPFWTMLSDLYNIEKLL